MKQVNQFNTMRLVYGIRSAVLVASAALIMACGNPAGDSAFASPVQFQTIAGKTFDSASLKGQVTLVNFWATSCTTCVKEMPMLSKQFTTFASRGYRTIAVAMDYDTPAFVSAFAKDRALPFDVVHDVDGSIAKAFSNVKLTPTSFLIDKQGRIAKRYVGEPDEQALKAAIEALLAQS